MIEIEILLHCWEKSAATLSALHAVSFGTSRWQILARLLVLQQKHPLQWLFASQSPLGELWEKSALGSPRCCSFFPLTISDVVRIANRDIASRLKMCRQCEMNWILFQNAHRRRCWFSCIILYLFLVCRRYGGFLVAVVCFSNWKRASTKSAACCPFKQHLSGLCFLHESLSGLCHLVRQQRVV